MSHPVRTSRCRRLASAVIVGAALCGGPLLAHDMWIEPTTFFPETGAIVGVRLRVGQDLLGDPIPRDPALIKQFIVETTAGRTPVIGRDGADPAGFLRVAMPGLLVIGYESHPSTVDLTPEKFNQYLKEEGLDAIAALRTRLNQTGRPAREAFSRCAKSLVQSGSVHAQQGDRALGFRLELVAEQNPYAIATGQELPLRLTYEGRPIADVLVMAMNRVNPSVKLTARTTVDGRVRFPLKRGGMWLVKAVHMIPAPAGSDAEWASYWASLTFELNDQR